MTSSMVQEETDLTRYVCDDLPLVPEIVLVPNQDNRTRDTVRQVLKYEKIKIYIFKIDKY